MASEEKVLTLSREEQGFLINSLNDTRNRCLQEGKPTELSEQLLLRAIHAPSRKRRWFDRESR